jgi:hypothetical protein
MKGRKTIEKSSDLGVNISLLEMEIAISNLFDIRKNIIVPNISWGLGIHECDLFIVRNTGYCIEVEIKRSKQDLKKDFEKKHSHIDKQNRIKDFYFAIPDYLYDSCKELIGDKGLITVSKWNNGKKTYIKAKFHTKSNSIKDARKLTDKEILKVLKLGIMRVWKLKEKLSKK